MLKKIFLTLKSFNYSGDSVGDDIRLEIKILDKDYTFIKRVKAGKTVKLNDLLAEIPTDRDSFLAKIQIKVIEEDPVFNDSANLEREFKINTKEKNISKLDYELTLKELRLSTRKVKAKFSVIIEAEVVLSETYITETDDGWLRVKIDGIKDEKSLPAFLRVELLRSDSKRDYFKIVEGTYKGKTASVKRKPDKKSYLEAGPIRRDSSIYATYSISKKIFTLNNKKYAVTDYPEMPWKKGLYNIEIPDAPHPGGRNYPEAGKGKVWFRIGHSGPRYLHAGTRSLGCMTITETRRWLEIYNTLIKARTDDLVSVAVLEIID